MTGEAKVDAPAEPTKDAPEPATGPGSEDNEAGLLDDMQVEDTQPPPNDQEMDPPVEDVGVEKKKDEPPKEGEAEPKKEGEPEAKSPDKPEEGAEPEPDAAPKLLAGQFETPEQLEVAYGESSKEGRRLNAELDKVRETSSSELKARDLTIARLEAQIKAGPKPVEASDEEIDAMSPAQLLRYNKKHADWDQRQKEIEQESRTESARLDKEATETKTYIIDRGEAMSKDAENFPGYSGLVPLMDNFVDWAPETMGHRKSPEMVYYAAYGYRALQAAKVSAKAKKTSEEAAQKKGAADAARGGGPGPTKTPKGPAGGAKKSPDDETDEEFNDRQIAEANKRGGSLFQ